MQKHKCFKAVKDENGIFLESGTKLYCNILYESDAHKRAYIVLSHIDILLSKSRSSNRRYCFTGANRAGVFGGRQRGQRGHRKRGGHGAEPGLAPHRLHERERSRAHLNRVEDRQRCHEIV